MIRRSQLRLVFHGAIFMVITMLVGGPELKLAFKFHFDEPVRQALRQWHAILMATGIWMIAIGAALPLLELTSRGISWIVWTLVFSGYSFTFSLGVLFAGFLRYPAASSLTIQWCQIKALHYFGFINFGLIVSNGVTSLIPALLIVWGAYRSMRHLPIDQIR